MRDEHERRSAHLALSLWTRSSTDIVDGPTFVRLTRGEAQKEQEPLSKEHPEATWLIREDDSF